MILPKIQLKSRNLTSIQHKSKTMQPDIGPLKEEQVLKMINLQFLLPNPDLPQQLNIQGAKARAPQPRNREADTDHHLH